MLLFQATFLLAPEGFLYEWWYVFWDIFVGMGHCQILLLLAGKAAISVGLSAATGGPNVTGLGHWVAVKAVAKVADFAGEGLRVAAGMAAK
ncbi:hypothetical protein U1Q18_035905 [Sarracenia purpurea var. burkii]